MLHDYGFDLRSTVLFEIAEETVNRSSSDRHSLVGGSVVDEERLVFDDGTADEDDTPFVTMVLIVLFRLEDRLRGSGEHDLRMIEIEQHRSDFVFVGIIGIHSVVEHEPAMLGAHRRCTGSPDDIVPAMGVVRLARRAAIDDQCIGIELIDEFDHDAWGDVVEDGNLATDLLGKNHPVLLDMSEARDEARFLPVEALGEEILDGDRGEGDSWWTDAGTIGVDEVESVINTGDTGILASAGTAAGEVGIADERRAE